MVNQHPLKLRKSKQGRNTEGWHDMIIQQQFFKKSHLMKEIDRRRAGFSQLTICNEDKVITNLDAFKWTNRVFFKKV